MFDGLGLKAVLDHHRRKLARELAWVEQITELKTFFFVVQLRSDISVFAEIIFDVQEREVLVEWRELRPIEMFDDAC